MFGTRSSICPPSGHGSCERNNIPRFSSLMSLIEVMPARYGRSHSSDVAMRALSDQSGHGSPISRRKNEIRARSSLVALVHGNGDKRCCTRYSMMADTVESFGEGRRVSSDKRIRSSLTVTRSTKSLRSLSHNVTRSSTTSFVRTSLIVASSTTAHKRTRAFLRSPSRSAATTNISCASWSLGRNQAAEPLRI